MARPITNPLDLDMQQQHALADALGVKVGTINGWLNGKARVIHARAIHSWLVEQGLDEGRSADQIAELLRPA